MKLNEKQITALEEKGFKRWTKCSMDRLYINAETLGLEIERRKTGSISSAYYRGERISNNRGSAMAYAKTYIDITTGELKSDNWTLEQDARQIYEEAMEAIEEAEQTTDKEDQTMSNYQQMTDSDLMIAEANANEILSHENSTTYSKCDNVTTVQREEALAILHDIRLEQWARGWNATPTADDREEYERYLARAESKLEAAIATGNEARIYAMKNRVNENLDALNYIASK